MLSDKFGNTLYREGDYIYLDLKLSQGRRRLGKIDEKKESLITKRVYDRHLFRMANSFGFNSELLRTAEIIKYVIVKTDKEETFAIPIETLFKLGSYLHFKKQGFERQIFITIDDLKNFKI